MGNDENFEIDFFRPPIHEKKLIWVTTNDRSGKGAINQRYGSHSACNHTHKCVQKYEGLNSPYFFGSSNYLLSLFVKLRCPDPSESPKATLAHVNTRWCFTLCLGTISGSYKTSYKYFFFLSCHIAHRATCLWADMWNKGKKICQCVRWRSCVFTHLPA